MVDEMDIFEKRLRDKEINWKWVFAHTAMIWIGSLILGSVVGFTLGSVLSTDITDSLTHNSEVILTLAGFANIITAFLVVFIISLVQKITWKHLFLVLILLFITSLYNVITYGFSVSDIFIGAIYLGIPMVIAKLLAVLILKTYEVIKK